MKPFKLDNKNKIDPGFKVPEDYFDTLTEKVMQQLPAKKIKVIPLYKRTGVWTSAVAAIFVIALSISILWESDSSKVPVDDTTMENYLAYQEDITQEDIIQGLSLQDIKELEASITLNDEAIESYLANEDYDMYLNE